MAAMVSTAKIKLRPHLTTPTLDQSGNGVQKRLNRSDPPFPLPWGVGGARLVVRELRKAMTTEANAAPHNNAH